MEGAAVITTLHPDQFLHLFAMVGSMGRLMLGITGLRGRSLSLQVLRVSNRTRQGHIPTGQPHFLSFSWSFCQSSLLVTKFMQSQLSTESSDLLKWINYRMGEPAAVNALPNSFGFPSNLVAMWTSRLTNVLLVTSHLLYGISVLVDLLCTYDTNLIVIFLILLIYVIAHKLSPLCNWL